MARAGLVPASPEGTQQQPGKCLEGRWEGGTSKLAREVAGGNKAGDAGHSLGASGWTLGKGFSAEGGAAWEEAARRAGGDSSLGGWQGSAE